MTSGFDEVLDPAKLKKFGVGPGTVAEVFARIVMAAPDALPQVDIATGVTQSCRPTVIRVGQRTPGRAGLTS